MRNKDEKKKRKGQESTIGKIIYGFLLFLPLLAIATTCLYAIFNKNAYQSYSGTTSNEIESVNITNKNEFLTNKNYEFFYIDSDSLSINRNESRIYFLKCTFKNTTYEDGYFDLYKSGVSSLYVNFNGASLNANSTLGINENLSFTLNILGNDFSNNVFNFVSVKQIIYNQYYYVNNVFYYSVDKVTQSALFNWAENSIIYTTTNATCNALSITTPFIPLLMSYWLIISVIYFLYDIALMLVWIIHRKIHELQESI